MPGHWTRDVFTHISCPGKEALLLSSEVQDGLAAAKAVGGLDEMQMPGVYGLSRWASLMLFPLPSHLSP